MTSKDTTLPGKLLMTREESTVSFSLPPYRGSLSNLTENPLPPPSTKSTSRVLHRSSSLGPLRVPSRGGDRFSTKSEGGRKGRISLQHHHHAPWHSVSSESEI